MRKHLILFLAVLACAACGSEKGRVAFTGEGASEATVDLKDADVAFWTDIDLEWQGTAELGYDVELVQGGTTVGKTTCNPLGHLSVKTSWTETNLGSAHSRHGMGKMDCTVSLPKGGATTVRAKLAFSEKRGTITLRKADLVLKQ